MPAGFLGAMQTMTHRTAEKRVQPVPRFPAPRAPRLKPRASRPKSRARGRRGVLILVVLAMLVLFVMVGVAFVITAGQFHEAARTSSRKANFGNEPQRDLDAAFYMLARDTNNFFATIIGHSLLRDMYGADGFKAPLASPNGAQWPAGGAGNQLIILSIDTAQTPVKTDWAVLDPPAENFALSDIDDAYTGQMLTVLTGPARYRTTPIVHYDAGNKQLWIRAYETRDGTWVEPADFDGAEILVNGRPFNGKGAGFDTATQRNDRKESVPGAANPAEIALVPNRSFKILPPDGTVFRPETKLFPNSPTDAAYLAGGADESYDAADYQNLFLAFVPPRPREFRVAQGQAAEDAIAEHVGQGRSIIPSFHRPALLRYWKEREGNLPVSLRSKLMLRPASGPPQSGGNPHFPEFSLYTGGVLSRGDAAIYGRWDVDNDGDGRHDSVWLDLGFPSQSLADGTLYKPLFAFLVVDLDGRANVNAHTQRGHVDPFNSANGATTLAGGTATIDQRPQGDGYGPADVDLTKFITVGGVTRLLDGDGNFLGRYGPHGSSPAIGQPGVAEVFDFKARVEMTEFPRNFFFDSLLSAYGTSPPNLRGIFALGLDPVGQPLFEEVDAPDLREDNPYELDLTHASTSGLLSNATKDAPFSVAELEIILRQNDFDSTMLPPRLTQLAPSLLDRNHRYSVTTHSFNVPVPSFSDPGTIDSMVELFQARAALAGLTGAALNGALRAMVADEMVRGLKFDLNRPFGNHRDDTVLEGASSVRNQVVDESTASATLPGVGGAQVESDIEKVWDAAFAGTAFENIDFAHSNGKDVNADGDVDRLDKRLARHLFARQLYVLMMLLKNGNVTFDVDGDGTAGTDADTAQLLAQFAVNVVDFRDADSIMTPFEFDINPFNGWDVDGFIAKDLNGDGMPEPGDDAHPERRVVWGMERPELLITETLAWHDRRTHDTTMDITGAKEGDDPNDAEETFDQKLAPRGAFFVELYNPWHHGSAQGKRKDPAEFYLNHSNNTLAGGVRLNQVSRNGGDPVWRMLVVRGPSQLDTNGLPTNPDEPNSAFDEQDIERTVFFVPSTAIDLTKTGIKGGNVATDHITYSTSFTGLGPVVPGRYAVIGSAGIKNLNNGDQVSTLGWASGVGTGNLNGSFADRMINAARRVVLRPNVNSNTNQVAVLGNAGKTPEEPNDGPGMTLDNSPIDMQAAVAVAMDESTPLGTGGKPRPFSVSEPLDGYPEMITDTDPDDAMNTRMINLIAPSDASKEWAYSDWINEPLDQQRTDGVEAVLKDGTTPNFCTVYLQRLANPLEPFHEDRNPYRTIDWMSVDLIAFNGMDAGEPTAAGVTDDVQHHVYSVQRGGAMAPGETVPPVRALWAFEQPHDAGNPFWGGDDMQQADPSTHNYPYPLKHSLGYLNDRYSQTNNAGYPGRYDATTAPAPRYIGGPNSSTGQPFPWLTWNNRPFISGMEIMQVPRSSSFSLSRDYSFVTASGSEYRGHPSLGDPDASRYGHLLNFFAHQSGATTSSLQAYKLLELVGVPSRYIGMEEILNPSVFSTTPTGAGVPQFRPPFNRISKYREPGKVNINTINSEAVWRAVMGDHIAAGPSWEQLVTSRRGYHDADHGAAPGNMFAEMDPEHAQVPTYFGNPFRTFGEAQLVPLTGDGSGAGTDQTFMQREPVDATLLRSFPIDLGADPPTLDPGSANTPPDPEPLFAKATVAPHNNAARNPYFRYQTHTRLDNLVTTRSSVFAVWITVGYFNVNKDTGVIQSEIGTVTGETRRHRAFYIFDRSIPVAFEPGKNHNVDDAVLVRRFIE